MSFWFVECDPVGNENLMRVLDSLGFGSESLEEDRMCNDGKKRTVIHLPNRLVSVLKKAKGVDVERALFQFKFFVADSYNGILRNADFIEKKYKSAKLKQMEEKILKLESRVNATRHIS